MNDSNSRKRMLDNKWLNEKDQKQQKQLKPQKLQTNPKKFNPEQWSSKNYSLFRKIKDLGLGSYGEVFLSENIKTHERVALKRVRMSGESEGFPLTAIREIKLLQMIDHKNVVKLKEVVTNDNKKNEGKGSIFMVFEYVDHDLAGLIDSPNVRKFTLPQIKCYIKQLLEGLHYCHSKKVLHRDIKGANLLVSNKGELKIADFGLARVARDKGLTDRVVTLWYRPPELLLGSTSYNYSVDMWSVGCVLAELLLRKPLLPGKKEYEQLDLIWSLCGTPDQNNWDGAKKLRYFQKFKPKKSYPRVVRETFKPFGKQVVDLLDNLLSLDPTKRMSAHETLDHEFFWTDPMPASPESLPTYPDTHELDSKKRREAMHQRKNPNNINHNNINNKYRKKTRTNNNPPNFLHRQCGKGNNKPRNYIKTQQFNNNQRNRNNFHHQRTINQNSKHMKQNFHNNQNFHNSQNHQMKQIHHHNFKVNQNLRMNKNPNLNQTTQFNRSNHHQNQNLNHRHNHSHKQYFHNKNQFKKDIRL
ncbi:cyclin-dependent kinase c-2 [Anaeramoeba flamelloides]|uniref:Cyclin-dependent kinase c-2 n=1 Tax=Anaeramoeba flamelloides TaxID=1746091 RepID=A0ABQ8YR51_9EUKA|nr:cyclin-dependent kinase c-2 [Anaeramoeba flamelloides]